MEPTAGRDYATLQRLYPGTYYDSAFASLRGGKVLELGCANGRIGQLVRVNAPHVKELYGVDYDAGLLAETPLDDYTALVQADLDCDIPFRDELFTDILALDVLEHLREPLVVLDRLASLLEPGGRLVIGIPNFLQIRNRIRIAAGKWSYEPSGGLFDEGHLRWFSLSNLQQLVPTAQYRLLSVKGYGWFPRGARLSEMPAADRAVRVWLKAVAPRAIQCRPQLLARSFILVAEKRGQA